MRIYVGQTRSAELVRRLWGLGIGECTVRGELPPRRHPWIFDNGAFKDWRAERQFDAKQFENDLNAIYRAIDRPEFIVLPDIVAGGLASLAFSVKWIRRCRGLAPLFLAVQDGMEPDDVDAATIRHIAGLFVGGTLGWKLQSAGRWVEFAHRRGLRCHIGRCGVETRIRWAQRIEADSIDSSLPLWSEENLGRFLRAIGPNPQRELFSGVAELRNGSPSTP